MMLMIPGVYQGPGGKKLKADFVPPPEDVAKMTKFNEDLSRAGVLISLDGLHPTAKGARVSFSGGKPKVTDGPFIESKEVLGGYWMVQVKSIKDAVEWASRCPARDGDVIEIRQVFDMEDFPPEVRKAGESATLKAGLEKQRHA
jgi:hypothetical protein